MKYWNDLFDKVDELQTSIGTSQEEVKKTIQTLQDEIDSLKQAVSKEKRETIDKGGVYMFGKHISGWYFYPFMFLVFLFLWLYGRAYYIMEDKAKQANVKLQVIRDEYGHVPSVKRTFEILDSTYANPIPPMVENSDGTN